MTTRTAIRMHPFTAVFISDIAEYEGLTLDVYHHDRINVLETYQPKPSAVDIGTHTAILTFPVVGTFWLRWHDEDQGVDEWDVVYVVDSVDPQVARSPVSTGVPLYPEIAGTAAQFATINGPTLQTKVHFYVHGEGTVDSEGVLEDLNTHFINAGVRVGDKLSGTNALVAEVLDAHRIRISSPTVEEGEVEYQIQTSVVSVQVQSGSTSQIAKPMVPDKTGMYVVRWYSSYPEDTESFVGYSVVDVFGPADERPVTIGVRDKRGRPLPNIHVTVTGLGGAVAYTRETDSDGAAFFQLLNGGYYVTFTDVYNPARVFDRNNMVFTVTPPLPPNRTMVNKSGEVIPQFPDKLQWVYKVDWLDLPHPVVPVSIVPSSDRAWMTVRVVMGPVGTPSMYRKFTVEQLIPMRLAGSSGYVVAAGVTEYSLDADGSAKVPLIRGAKVKVAFAAANLTTTFTVPDKAEFNFIDVESLDPFGVTLPKVFYPYRTTL